MREISRKRRYRTRKKRRKHKRRRTTRRKRRQRRRRRTKRRRRRRSRGGAPFNLNPSDITTLKRELVQYGVNAATIDNEWLPGKKKTLQQLLGEIDKGETRLEVKDGKVRRIVNVARVKIFRTTAHDRVLKEVRQIKEDKKGNIVVTDRDVILSEKMLPEEIAMGPQGVIAAIRRGINEELGSVFAFKDNYQLSSNFRGPDGKYVLAQAVHHITKTEEIKPSCHSYPGLPCKYIYHTVEGLLPDLTAKYPSGGPITTKDEDGKSIIFEWKPVS